MKIHPLDDRVIVRPDPADERSAGGILIPDSAKERPMVGEVVAAGAGRVSDHTGEPLPMAVKVGDIVMFPRYSGVEVQLGRETVLMFRVAELMAVIEIEATDDLRQIPVCSECGRQAGEHTAECPHVDDALAVVNGAGEKVGRVPKRAT